MNTCPTEIPNFLSNWSIYQWLYPHGAPIQKKYLSFWAINWIFSHYTLIHHLSKFHAINRIFKQLIDLWSPMQWKNPIFTPLTNSLKKLRNYILMEHKPLNFLEINGIFSNYASPIQQKFLIFMPLTGFLCNYTTYPTEIPYYFVFNRGSAAAGPFE